MILIALSRQVEVGVDVERLSPAFSDPAELVEMARDSFPPAIALAVERSTPGSDRQRAFLSAWVFREAVAKADGRGIVSPLNYRVYGADDLQEGIAERRVSLEVPSSGAKLTRMVDYFVQTPNLGNDCLVALATRSPGAAISLQHAGVLLTPRTAPVTS
jgi:hypothetical protein